MADIGQNLCSSLGHRNRLQIDQALPQLISCGAARLLSFFFSTASLLSQILQSLRMEIAGRAEVDPFDVSMQLLIQYLPKLAAKGEDPIETFIKYGRQARFIRPSSRLRTEAPAIPPDLFIPLPPDLILIRKPRYAGKT
ncbi:MAG: hypothetical protein H6642_14000 [Caldilineaceae bacterium]|nr:hypothetical protein [Caldilineaceae bacterium]